VYVLSYIGCMDGKRKKIKSRSEIKKRTLIDTACVTKPKTTEMRTGAEGLQVTRHRQGKERGNNIYIVYLYKLVIYIFYFSQYI
jgi:hypothetical protein